MRLCVAEEGNPLAEDGQWAKLAMIVEVRVRCGGRWTWDATLQHVLPVIARLDRAIQ